MATPPPRGTGRSWLDRRLGRSTTPRAASESKIARASAQVARPVSGAAIRATVSMARL